MEAHSMMLGMEESMKKKIIYAAILLAFFCMASGCKGREEEGFFLKNAEGAGEESSPEDLEGDPKGPTSPDVSPAGDFGPAPAIYVQVSGAVAKPGVYELTEGSRIFQAVELAGGMTEEADAGALNQAAALSDGQMVYVPKEGEGAGQAGALGAGTRQPQQDFGGTGQPQQADGKVALNTATEAELMALPGIGAAKAKSILAWREEHGGFSQIEDLMKIEGIKDGVFSKIKDSIKVD